MSETRLILLAPIALLALLTLLSPKPSLSTLFMFIQASLVAYFLDFESVSILLTIFCLPALAAHLYLEKCLPRYSTTPALNLILGALLLLAFVLFAHRLKNLGATVVKLSSTQSELDLDRISIMGIIFIFFVVIISAFSVINNKKT